ncbi:ABC transporter permease [Fulvivirgaceae bacterium PWU4]|uniref:ABC transporter permease n=1 Tax=Chryseosolibacter histidini TaxID=2782349 RepID=A0AAP2GJ60_9BACT|nr:ABC transporter permease [Chryseosolibacter histidini]MBT1697689.1 ABC transporter permease [Chryseosolibacter histidini]
MISSYLKLALRLLARSPLMSLINVLGLAAGFTVFFVLWPYTRHELASEQFIRDYDRIVRFGIVWNQLNKNDEWSSDVMATSHPGVAHTIGSEFTEVESFTRVFYQQNFTRAGMPHGKDFTAAVINTTGEKVLFQGEHFAYADPNVFSFFGLPLVSGDPEQVLAEPGSLVVSEDFALRHFGHGSPIGRQLFIHDTVVFHITGVFKNLPANTHMKLEAVASDMLIRKKIDVTPFTAEAHTYFRLRTGTDRLALEKRLNGFNTQHWEPVVRESGYNTSRVKLSSYLQPLQDIPFSKFSGDHHFAKSRDTLRFLNVVPLIILAMAWINYVNLIMASHGKRIKELITRKNAGARPLDFIRQFALESLLINVIACLLAVVFIKLFRYPLQVYLHFYVPSPADIPVQTALVMTAMLVTGIFAPAAYAALVTLNRTPHALMTSVKWKNNETVLGKTLVVFQYTSAIVLVVYAFAVYRQLDAVLNSSMGIDRRDVVVIDAPANASRKDLDFFVRQCETFAGVEQLTTSTHITGDDAWSVVVFWKESDSRAFLAHSTGGVDAGFIPFYGIELVAGRNFSATGIGDSSAIIVSEAMVEFLGLSDAAQAVGKTLSVWTRRGEEKQDATIVGVIRSFQEKTLFRHVEADQDRDALGHSRIILTYGSALTGFQRHKISLRIPHKNLDSTLAGLETSYRELFPGKLFRWSFLEDHMNRHYSYEKVTRNQIIVFTVLAIFIACLGLLGAIDNKALQKQREVVIRKVYGASMVDVSGMLMLSTARHMTLSVVLGIPLAIYPVRQYLAKFAPGFSFGWWHYAIPVLILIVILLATVSSVLLNAARKNPVDVLRHN